MIYVKQNRGSTAPRKTAQLGRKLRYALTGQSNLSQPSFQPDKVLGAPHVEWLPQPEIFFFENPHGWVLEMANEFHLYTTEVRSGRDAPKHLFDHHTISFSPEDQTKFAHGPGQMDPMAIVREALWEGAFCDRPHIIVMHRDTPHLNAHIYLATTDLRGRCYRWLDDYREFEVLMEAIELNYGLTRVHARTAMARSDPSRLPGVKARTSNEVEMTERTGQKSARVELQEQLDCALRARTFAEFADSCAARGIGVSLFRVGHVVRGVTYYHGAEVMKASDLGVKYGWPFLHTKFEIDLKKLNHCRDMQRLEQVVHDIQATPCKIIMKTGVNSESKNIARYPLNKLEKIEIANGIQYRWKRNGTPAFTDSGREIHLHTTSETTVTHALKHAVNSGWTDLIAKGTRAVKSLISSVWAKVRPVPKARRVAAPIAADSQVTAKTEASTGLQRLMDLGTRPTGTASNLARSGKTSFGKRTNALLADSSVAARVSVGELDPTPEQGVDARRIKRHKMP